MRRFLVLLLLSCPSGAAFLGAQIYAPEDMTFTSANITSSRSLAMGGAHTALPDGLYSFFVNPALLKEAADTRVAEISFGTIGSPALTYELLMSFLSDFDFSSRFKTLVNDKMPRVPAGLDFRGPLVLGFVNKGFAAGLFMHLCTDSYIDDNKETVNINFDLDAHSGYAFTFVDTADLSVDLGVAAKLFVRQVSTVYAAEIPTTADFKFVDMKPKTISGGGIDLGFSAAVENTIFFGASLSDAFTAAFVQPLKTADDITQNYVGFANPDLSIGAALKVLDISGLVWTASLDYHNIVTLVLGGDYATSTILANVGIGMELVLRRWLALRLGLSELLPGGGVGFDFEHFTLNVSVYGKQMGATAGDYPVFAWNLGFAWKF